MPLESSLEGGTLVFGDRDVRVGGQIGVQEAVLEVRVSFFLEQALGLVDRVEVVVVVGAFQVFDLLLKFVATWCLRSLFILIDGCLVTTEVCLVVWLLGAKFHRL